MDRPDVQARAAGRTLVHLASLSVFHDHGRRCLLDTVELKAHAHEIVGVAGVSGNGQTILADVLCGLRRFDTGQYLLQGNPRRSAPHAR